MAVSSNNSTTATASELQFLAIDTLEKVREIFKKVRIVWKSFHRRISAASVHVYDQTMMLLRRYLFSRKLRSFSHIVSE